MNITTFLTNNEYYNNAIEKFVDENLDHKGIQRILERNLEKNDKSMAKFTEYRGHRIKLRDRNEWVKIIDGRVQNLFKYFISAAKVSLSVEGFLKEGYHKTDTCIDDTLTLDKASESLLSNIASSLFGLRLSFFSPKGNIRLDGLNHAIYKKGSYFFNTRDLHKHRFSLSWTDKNKFIYDPPLGPYFNQQEHFEKELQHAQQGGGKIMTIHVGNRTWNVHSSKLFPHSDVFQTMFQSNLIEAKEKEVVVNGFNPQVFGAFIEFIYTGTLKKDTLEQINIMELIEFANFYNVKGLRHYCADLLNEHFRDNDLDPMEFSQLLEMGLANNCTDLLEVYLVHAHNSLENLIPANEKLTLKYFDLWEKEKQLKDQKDQYIPKILAIEELTQHDFALLKNICEKYDLFDFLETLKQVKF